MDQWLANIYGTNGGGDDLEKTAQNMLLQKLAEEEGVDLSGLDEEQLAALAQEVLGGEEQQAASEEQVEMSPEETEAYLAKEAQAKFEEADFLGRVMAHSYTQELEKIASVRGLAMKAGKGLARGAEWVGEKLTPKKLTQHVAEKARKAHGQKMYGTMRKKGLTPGDIGEFMKDPSYSRAHLRGSLNAQAKAGEKLHKRVGAGAAGAATLATGGAVHHGMKEKDASAFEKLAELRAAEILQANGVDPSTGAPMQEPQEQMGQEEQFGQALDQRAVEILAENGYDVSGLVGEEQPQE
jgi:hypothetical protein